MNQSKKNNSTARRATNGHVEASQTSGTSPTRWRTLKPPTPLVLYVVTFILAELVAVTS